MWFVVSSSTKLAEIRALREVLRITKEEEVAIDYHTDPAGNPLWDADKAKPKEVFINALGLEILQGGFEKLDKAGQAYVDHLDVWERFKGLKTEVVEKAGPKLATPDEG